MIQCVYAAIYNYKTIAYLFVNFPYSDSPITYEREYLWFWCRFLINGTYCCYVLTGTGTHKIFAEMYPHDLVVVPFKAFRTTFFRYNYVDYIPIKSLFSPYNVPTISISLLSLHASTNHGMYCQLYLLLRCTWVHIFLNVKLLCKFFKF